MVWPIGRLPKGRSNKAKRIGYVPGYSCHAGAEGGLCACACPAESKARLWHVRQRGTLVLCVRAAIYR
jgi:hypothetical protein